MNELRKSFWDFLAISGANILAFPIMFLSESIQARHLGAADYGKMMLILSLISLFDLVGLNWLRYAVIKFGKEELIKNNTVSETLSSTFLLSLVSLFATLTIFYFYSTFIFTFFDFTHQFAIEMIIIGLILNSLKLFILDLFKIFGKMKEHAFLSRLFVKLIFIFGLFVLINSAISFNIFTIIVTLFLADFFLILYGLYLLDFTQIFPLKLNKSHTKLIFKYSFPLIFASWSGYIINWVDAYLIKYYLQNKDVGYYLASYKIFNTFKTYFRTSLITIITPIVIVYKAQGDTFKISTIYLERIVPQLSIVFMLLVSIASLFSNILIPLIYGDEFISSISIFKFLF